jgi:hypothetical protein
MFDLYFGMFDLGSGLKCEQASATYFRAINDTSVSQIRRA